MSDSRGATSVRSLLARFENNNVSSTTSPPSRGRSPTADPSGGARPLSKVRASFVAVERATQSNPTAQLWGMRRSSEFPDSPGKPPVTQRLGSPIDRSTAISPTGSIGRHASVRALSSSPPQVLATIQQINNNSNAAGKKSPGLDTVPKGASQNKAELDLPKTETMAPQSKVDAKSTRVSKKEPSTPATAASVRPSNVIAGKDSHPRAGATKRSPTSAGPKSPLALKAPKTPGTPSARQASTTANTPVAKRDTADRASRITSKKPSTIRSSSHPAGKVAVRARPQPSAPNTDSNGRKSSTQTSPNTNKLRPKSPTRPLRLPSSMTAFTASAAAKLNNGTPHVGRPDSQTGVHGTVAATATARKAPPARSSGAAGLRPTTPTNRTIRKHASHATLAPSSHTTAAHDRPRSRVSNVGGRAPDESFLARMMRPTASSASKMHDRVEIKSPPRLAAPTSAPSAKPTIKPPQRRTSSEKKDQKQTSNHDTPASPQQSSREQDQQINGTAAVTTSPPKSEEPLTPVEPASPEQVQQATTAVELVIEEPPQVKVEPELPTAAPEEVASPAAPDASKEAEVSPVAEPEPSLEPEQTAVSVVEEVPEEEEELAPAVGEQAEAEGEKEQDITPTSNEPEIAIEATTEEAQTS